MEAAEGGLFLIWCFISEYSYSWPHLFFFKILKSFHHKKYREFIMSFSSAVRRSRIPSVLVLFLDLLQRHSFFFQNARNVYVLLWCGWRGWQQQTSPQLFYWNLPAYRANTSRPKLFFSLAAYYDISLCHIIFNFRLVTVTMAEARSISVCFMIRYWGKFAICCLVYLCVVTLQYFVPLSQVPL